jgi:hypothetical protein
MRLWDRLGRVRGLHFVGLSANESGWNGSGVGTVVVASPSPEVLIFNESGVWQPTGGGRISFRNVFRWRRLGLEAVRLEHLRYGADHPVYLFDLMSGADGVWTSVSPHCCRDDCYRAILEVEGVDIVLRWSVTGPSKQETIEYRYFP